MLLILLFTFSLIWLAILRWTRRQKIQCYKQFKNDIPTLPVIGHFHIMFGNGEAKMKGIQALGREALKQGGVTVVQSWVLDTFFAIVADAETAEIILRNCLEKADSMKTFHSIFGCGLLVAPVREWRWRRKILNPLFTLKYLDQNVDIFQSNSAYLVDKLLKVSNNGPISLYDHFTAYSLDTVVETIYGFRIEAQKNTQHPIMKAFNVCCQLISNRICLPWLHNQTVYELTSQSNILQKNARILFEFLDEKIIKKCKEITEKTSTEAKNNHKSYKPIQLKSILELMMESFSKNNEPLSDIYLREETFILTFAATETTSITLSFILVMLSRYPHIQEKVYQEVMQVLEDFKEPIKAEHLPHLKYTEAVINETLRMYPPATALLRKIDKDITLPSGKTLVAGTGVMINVWAVHNNPLYWEDPEQFRPERFLESALKHPAAFLAFSYGIRNCIGSQYAIMSLKTSLASLIRQYRVLPANNDPKEVLKPLRIQFDIVMRDVDNYTVQLITRS